MRKVFFHLVLILIVPVTICVIFALVEFGFRFWDVRRSSTSTEPLSSQPSEYIKGQFELSNHLHEVPSFSPQDPKCNKSVLKKDLYFPPGVVENGVSHLAPDLTFRGVATDSQGQEAIVWNLTTDPKGRRTTPGKSKGQKHALFFGCSNTLGEGVNDSQTLPYFSTAEDAQFKGYNLGISGGSVGDAIGLIEQTSMLDSIEEKEGVAIFTFIWAHLDRFCGDWKLVGSWLQGKSAVIKTEQGDYTFNKMWHLAHPTFTKISTFLSKSKFLQWANVRYCLQSGDPIEEYAIALNSLRKLYWKKLGARNRFVVVFQFSGRPYGQNFSHAQKMKKHLDRLQIEYVDYSSRSIATVSENNPLIPIDCHPSGEGYRVLGNLIRQDILFPMQKK
jgi:hypothetical protein